MKYLVLFMLFPLVLFSCKKNKESTSNSQNHFVIDTIIEKSDSEKLDLERQQLFIETNKNSKLYKQFLNASLKIDSSTMREIGKNFHLEKLYFKLYKKGNKFYLYQRCDGGIIKYYDNGTSFYFFGAHENIKFKVLKKSGDTYSLEGGNHLKIIKTAHKNISKLEYSLNNIEKVSYLSSIDHISNFDVIINHCPNFKVDEYFN